MLSKTRSSNVKTNVGWNPHDGLKLGEKVKINDQSFAGLKRTP